MFNRREVIGGLLGAAACGGLLRVEASSRLQVRKPVGIQINGIHYPATRIECGHGRREHGGPIVTGDYIICDMIGRPTLAMGQRVEVLVLDGTNSPQHYRGSMIVAHLSSSNDVYRGPRWSIRLVE